VLSANGEKLFRNAIPGVQNMAPAIFYVQNGEFDTTGRSWGSSLMDGYKVRFFGGDGVAGGGDDDWVVWGLVGMSEFINVPFLLIIALMCVGACVGAIYLSYRWFGTGEAGYMASFIIIIGFGIVFGLLTAVALIGLFLVLVAGWFLLMKRA